MFPFLFSQLFCFVMTLLAIVADVQKTVKIMKQIMAS